MIARAADAPLAIDADLVGLTLGPWTMIAWWISVPCALAVAAVLAWYFRRLASANVPQKCRVLRRVGVCCAGAALVPLVIALTVAHPHEHRVAWAFAWTLALLSLFAWFVLAVVDAIIVARGGVHEYRALRRDSSGHSATAPSSTAHSATAHSPTAVQRDE